MSKLPPPTYKNFEFDLGVEAECLVTGAHGIVVSRCQNLNGTTGYHLQPTSDFDNKVPEPVYVDQAFMVLSDDTLDQGKDGGTYVHVLRSTRQGDEVTQAQVKAPMPIPQNPQPL